ncbi:unnamed protein product [Leptidea sinapis]|uniref:Uncharacterized protein n=1 Tax=Leptidea sinapis TaxID=189913 RepID=A0A5E4R872_9NEOP|nr:unnamed protein product [Leptidea sinapis]
MTSGNFTCLEVIFKLKRRLGYHLFNTYIPTCLIVIMSLKKSIKNSEPADAARAKARAINIDRFSRVFFPFLFSVLNATYWIQFAQYI